MIQVYNASVSYQKEAAVLSNVSFRIGRGEFVFVTGPSGAGKSTLLKLLYGAVAPDKGQVVVDGQNITRMSRSQLPFLRRSLGLVFQDFKLLPNRTVLENVALTLEVLGWNKRDIGKKAYHVLKQVGMEQKMNMKPLRLSGGEQQRAALARALVNDPKVLLADEPTGNLDDVNRNQVMAVLREANLRGTTVVVATHDRRIIDSSHRRVIVLEKGEIRDHAGAAE